MRKITRYTLLACGWVSLGLGLLGVVLPLLPTAPFVLLAAACFVRSSETMHRWLVEHPVLGAHIRDYLAGRGLTRQTKLVAITTLWMSVLASTWLFVPLWFADVAIVLTALAVTVYLTRLPTAAAAYESPSSP